MTSALSPRLAAIAARVLGDGPMADIGTDHALLPMHLVAHGDVPSAVAVDVSAATVRKAAAAVARLPEEHRAQVSVRHGDGLSVVAEGEVRTVVIAGMGGDTIEGILRAGRSQLASVQRLVLSPNRGATPLRRSLVELGWTDVDGEMVRDRAHFYPVVAWERGTAEWSDLDYRWGRCIRASPGSGLAAFLAHEQVRLEAAREAVRAGRGEADAKVVRFTRALAQISAELQRV